MKKKTLFNINVIQYEIYGSHGTTDTQKNTKLINKQHNKNINKREQLKQIFYGVVLFH